MAGGLGVTSGQDRISRLSFLDDRSRHDFLSFQFCTHNHEHDIARTAQEFCSMIFRYLLFSASPFLIALITAQRPNQPRHHRAPASRGPFATASQFLASAAVTLTPVCSP